MSISTYTYTWTRTRLETIQDQFHYLLTYAGFSGISIDEITDGVGEEAIDAVGIYGCNRSGLRVIEVELRIDWALSSRLKLTVPTIPDELSGWDGKQAPEIKVAGRRFSEAVESLGLSTNCWISLAPGIRNNPSLRTEWERKLHIAGYAPDWESDPQERNESLMDLGEASVYIRRAGR
jgi:hypothetical protein